MDSASGSGGGEGREKGKEGSPTSFFDIKHWFCVKCHSVLFVLSDLAAIIASSN